MPGSNTSSQAIRFPDSMSRTAAEKVTALLKTCDARSLIFFLISGGGSAMMEQPLSEAISIDDTVAFYKALVYSGLLSCR